MAEATHNTVVDTKEESASELSIGCVYQATAEGWQVVQPEEIARKRYGDAIGPCEDAGSLYLWTDNGMRVAITPALLDQAVFAPTTEHGVALPFPALGVMYLPSGVGIEHCRLATGLAVQPAGQLYIDVPGLGGVDIDARSVEQLYRGEGTPAAGSVCMALPEGKWLLLDDEVLRRVQQACLELPSEEGESPYSGMLGFMRLLRHDGSDEAEREEVRSIVSAPEAAEAPAQTGIWYVMLGEGQRVEVSPAFAMSWLEEQRLTIASVSEHALMQQQAVSAPVNPQRGFGVT